MFVDLYPFFKENRLLMAPMAGISDAVFRHIVCEYGCDLAYSEMVSAKGLSFDNEKTHALIDRFPGETRMAVQIFGHEPTVMAHEAARIEDELRDDLAYIDINMGCPARKIVKKGDGSALMKDPGLASRIVAEVNNAVSVPVTAKFRRGYYEGEETCVEFAKRLEEAGASALTVHGRFAMQLYRGNSDRSAIARAKEAVAIPVVGNGDVRCGTDALDLMSETFCDAVMIARGALGSPWIFTDAKYALSGEVAPDKPDALERIAIARHHAKLLYEREPRGMVRMRKHAMWYVAGLPGASVARGRFNYCKTFKDFNDVFDELEARLREES